MNFQTCSDNKHFFNYMFVGVTWDRYCDCRKERMSKKDYKEILEALEAKVDKLDE